MRAKWRGCTMLAGCGGSQPPIGAPGATSYGAPRHIAAHPAPATAKGAWSGDLLYVATGGDVYVLSYPSGKVVGRLGVDARQPVFRQTGNVFVVQGETIVEYSHRGKLLQTLPTYDVPQSCSVDPTTGNLAVPTVDYSCVYIYPDARPPAQSVCDDYFVIPACAHTIATEICFSTVLWAADRTTRTYLTLPNFPKAARRSATTASEVASGTTTTTASIGTARMLRCPILTRIRSTACVSRTKRRSSARRTSVDGLVDFSTGTAARRPGLRTERSSRNGVRVPSWRYGRTLRVGNRPRCSHAFASAGTSVDGVVLSLAPH